MSDPKTANPPSEIVAPESLESQGYAVGYKKPPKASQFKPGQSGNPKGRPRSNRNLAGSLAAILNETVTLREGGRTRKISKGEAMLRTLTHKALKGDARAFSLIAALAKELGHFEDLTKGEGRYGVLLISRSESREEWERITEEQQRPYREK
jgi:uncharacterized protein DUF5681